MEHAVELSQRLSKNDVKQLIAALNVPHGLAETMEEPVDFVTRIDSWEEFNHKDLIEALGAVGRNDLCETACKVKRYGKFHPRKTTSMGELICLLRNNIERKDWKLIAHEHGFDPFKGTEESDYEKIFESCIDNGIITKDLINFEDKLKKLKRNDLSKKLTELRNKFKSLTRDEFARLFRDWMKNKNETADTEIWKRHLEQHMISQYSKVESILGEEEISLKEIYIPLTVSEQKPDSISVEDESTENELDFLEKFYSIKKGETTDSQMTQKSTKDQEEKDIIELLKSKDLIDIAIKDKRDRDYKLRQDVTWLIIGHPGSGKTFLCSRIALLYSDGDLEKFDYCLTIPCRNPEWHSIEIKRNKDEKGVTREFVREWLQLGMPEHGSTRWREKLAKHILDKDGEGLLLIVDSLDEFTQNIRVEQTLLSVLLQRKFLNKCTLILTSRPGEWSNISSAIPNIEIDFYFQVLGFSPDNRDRYFKNQLDKDKFNDCLKMFYSHHEINLLSLIPVNASFFATLFQSHIATSYTLTKLYSSLILYLIKRQLSRMNLKEEKNMKAESLEGLEANVKNCLYEIGEVAYLGVAERKLTSTEKFKLVLGKDKDKDKDEIDSQWLGLVNVSIKKDAQGEKTQVWSFSHLTLQEFVGALWLSNERTMDIFLITRYVVSTNETFALFKMVMRFLCGIKKDDAKLILYIIYKYQLVNLSYNEFPYFHQNRYESKHEDNLFNFSDCQLFTNQFISLSPFLVETNLESSEPLELQDKKGHQQTSIKNVTLYIQSNIAPNDWHNLTKSLHFFKKIHLFYFDSTFLTCQDLLSLIEELRTCRVTNLTIRFVNKEYSHITEYLNTIKHFKNTVFSFNLEGCSLNDNAFIKDLKMLTEHHHVSSINLSYNTISPQILDPLIAQVNPISNIYFRCRDNATDYPILVPKLIELTNLRGLHLFGIPDVELARLSSSLTALTNLQEISCYQHNAYSILSEISPLCKLSYLDISGYSEQTKGFEKHLYELLRKNSETLKTLILYKIESIGVLYLNPFFDSLKEFTSLVRLKLEYCRLELGTSNLKILTLPKSLVCLELWRVPIGDKGLLKLGRIVCFHGSLRFLMISYAKLTSKSCVTLSNLICTMRCLKRLVIFQKELLNPDDKQYEELSRTANQFSIELRSSDW